MKGIELKKILVAISISSSSTISSVDSFLFGIELINEYIFSLFSKLMIHITDFCYYSHFHITDFVVLLIEMNPMAFEIIWLLTYPLCSKNFSSNHLGGGANDPQQI